MANMEHVKLVLQAEDWTKWREHYPGVVPDFREANFSGANLCGADLRGADLVGANLNEVNLFRADLRGANLFSAKLSEANLSGADLVGANLSRANLFRANLSRANLRGANLTEAILFETNFGAAVLQGAKGLSECTFQAPCILDYSAIQKSGTLPLLFLRGCGLPDSLIDYLPALLNEAIQFFSCFISYSTKDQAFADRLYADLQAGGVRCWFAPHDIQGGRKIHEQISEAIRFYDKLLLILSEASMNSNWVKTEIANARAREDEQKRQILFPITVVAFNQIERWKLFDADRGIDSAREIRQYFIPDFSNWKDHDSYAKAFDRLLRDLKVAAGDKAAA